MTEQRTAKYREQHLYLVLDDWHSGYRIRKVSLSRRSGKNVQQPLSSGSVEGAEPLSRRSGKRVEQPLSSGSVEGAEPLPEIFMSIQAERGCPQYFASAFGTKILVMHPGIAENTGGIPMIDVEERSVEFGPEPNYNAVPIYFPVGDNKIFILDFGTFHCYLCMPEQSDPWWRLDLPFPPFERADVCSYGVRPDGCILVSTLRGRTTFILDTSKEEYTWKPYGNWVLPFTGGGHYDTSLEGFVGLSRDDPETLGYLYCSMLPSTGTGDTLHPLPDLRCSREKVFTKNPAERHVSATLVHMRPGGFCLVECVAIGDNGRADQELREPAGAAAGGVPKCGCFMYRLKTFSLGYDGERHLKLKNCRVRCYSLPREVTSDFLDQDPAAFWL